MTVDEREKGLDPSLTGLGDTRSPTQPWALDDRIAVAVRLLPQLRCLGASDLRALAVHLRILSNVAEAWAQRRSCCEPMPPV
jgi:hypothetical protein